ncbi:MAG: hypothetical protein LW832_08735 [Parachlamydia sp.]|jgi:hypothetical protein|nr:hypothetical protein [Parachlamydia sp.]
MPLHSLLSGEDKKTLTNLAALCRKKRLDFDQNENVLKDPYQNNFRAACWRWYQDISAEDLNSLIPKFQTIISKASAAEFDLIFNALAGLLVLKGDDANGGQETNTISRN